MFNRKIYNKLQQWKNTRAGKTALLVDAITICHGFILSKSIAGKSTLM